MEEERYRPGVWRQWVERKCTGNEHRRGARSVDRSEEEAKLKEEQRRGEEPNLI